VVLKNNNGVMESKNIQGREEEKNKS
jgi:hypothetical protein